MIWWLLACSSPPSPPPAGGSLAESASTASSGDSGRSASTPLCDEVSGLRGLVVASLTDPDDVLVSSDDEAPAVATLAGPDRGGFVYAGDHSGRVVRSADGCTWEEVGRMPPRTEEWVRDTAGRPVESYYGGELMTSPHSDRLYLYESPGTMMVSVDGGASFTTLPGELRPDRLLVHPNDEDQLRITGLVDQLDGVHTSTDGGQTWTPLPLRPPEPADTFVHLHTSDWDVVATSWRHLALSDDFGASWAVHLEDCEVRNVTWDDGGLTARCVRTEAGVVVAQALRTTDMGQTFDPLPIDDDGVYIVQLAGYADGTLVTAGHSTDDGPLLELTTATRTVRHGMGPFGGTVRGMAVLGDRAVIAFEGQSFTGP